MGPIAAVSSAYRRAFQFSGRAPRSEFWWFALFVAIVLNLFHVVALPVVPVLVVGLVQLGVFSLPLAACIARRVRDAGRHGLWSLPPVLMVLGSALGLVLFPEAMVGLGVAATEESSMTGGDVFLMVVGLMGFLSLPAFIFCFLASTPPALAVDADAPRAP